MAKETKLEEFTEQEMLRAGKAEYKKKLRKAKAEGKEAETLGGRKLTLEVVQKVAEGIEEWKEKVTSRPGSGKIRYLLYYLEPFDSRHVAWFTSRAIVNACARPVSFTNLADKISKMLEDHADYERFKVEAKREFKITTKNLEKVGHYGHRKVVFTRFQRWAGVTQANWSQKQRIILGKELISIFKETTGYIQVEQVRTGKRIIKKVWNKKKKKKVNKILHKKHLMVIATQEFKDKLNTYHSTCSLFDPYYEPLLTFPKPWKEVSGGGYHTFHKLRVVKTNNNAHIDELDNKREELHPVYEALNTMQETAWRVNQEVYQVVKEAWDSKHSEVYALPRTELLPMPLCPICHGTVDSEKKDHPCFELKENKPAFLEWKEKTADVYSENVRRDSKVLTLQGQVRVASKFYKELRFYFPYTLDWRGRVYPVPLFLTPQSDDVGKALLEFSESKPLGSSGLRWLKIHAANMYGEDKISLDDREKWTDDHTEEIIEAAKAPLDDLWWVAADKPYQFLAVALELARYWEAEVQGIGELFESRIPCSIDGSCNGLQNYSAMLRDDIGGKEVNLIPSDLPHDIYSNVADGVAQEIAFEADQKDDQELSQMAQLWEPVFANPKLRRKLVKRNVMTLPYAATVAGMREQLISEIQKIRDKHTGDTQQMEFLRLLKRLPDLPGDLWEPCFYLAKTIYRIIPRYVPAATDAMRWLKEVAQIHGKARMPISWTTPVGFWVQQKYPNYDSIRMNCLFGDVRIQPVLLLSTDDINVRKMSQSVAPNFIHSMDASHLMKTILLGKQKGIKAFAMVHDSYGTYAKDIETLSQLLRQAFVEQYQRNVLKDFREEVKEQLPQRLEDQIPKLPEQGNLNLQMIAQALYFFA